MTDSEPKPTELIPDAAAPQTPPQAADVPPPPPEPALVPEPEPVAPTAVPGLHVATGRRKSAVARVRLSPGGGAFLVNNREIDHFFTEPQDRSDAVAPLTLTGVRKQWDVKVNVRGGGHTGQAGAVRLGVARALMKAYSQFEITLRDAGYLTRDARRVERKKPGQRKARRRFQFSKR